MTKKTTNSTVGNNPTSEYHKLSIQISLNGLSFCVLDTLDNNLLISEQRTFPKELIPFEAQKNLKELLEEYRVTKYTFSEVVVIHRNKLFSFVPKALFDEKELANYLKFNAKILANDLIVYDEIESHDLVNVYVPFVNINNYIYDLFGEFEFKHSSTVLIQSLLNHHGNGNDPVCYIQVLEQQMDITVIAKKKLLLFSSFDFTTKEDFIYYLLFTMEQLNLDTSTVAVKLFGTIEEGDPNYDICYTYVKNVSIFVPPNLPYHLGGREQESIDFTTLNAL